MQLPLDIIVPVGLAIIASQSPIQTFAALWQTKEWRWDRLRTHLLREGILRQLLGVTRPTVVAMTCIAAAGGIVSARTASYAALWILAGSAVVQRQSGRQPRPVGTQKARILLAGTTGCTALIALALAQKATPSAWLLLSTLPLIQPLLFAVVWALFLPIDRRAKQRILRRARSARSRYGDAVTVIGITGSVGKTTTKSLLAHLLAPHGALATPEHVNTEIGVAQWFLTTCGGNDAPPPLLVIEMGAYRGGEIALLADVMQPNIGAISFIGTQHIALFGSREQLCDAKGELFASLPNTGHAFLNADSPFADRLQAKCRCALTTVGTGAADMQAYDIEETTNGLRFRVATTTFEVPLHGTHNVTNVLLAIAIARHVGDSDADIAARLRSYQPAERTFGVRNENGVTILDDTHNASPASFAAAISWAASQPGTPKILLTPGLIEQGEEQQRVHEELGAAAASVFDRVIFLHARSAKEFERGYGKHVSLFSDALPPIPPGALLVCVGRMPERHVRFLLP